jgi:hypothetical protein
MNKTKTLYRLDFVVTRTFNPDGTYTDLPIDKFLTFPGSVTYTDKDSAEIARIDLSRTANNGYYKVVEF